MPNIKGPSRGLRNIRTMAGKVDQSFEPYNIYMQISVLEMERARRGKEKQSAMERVAQIEQRFQQIDKEKERLLQLVNDNRTLRSCNRCGRPSSESKGSFKIKY